VEGSIGTDRSLLYFPEMEVLPLLSTLSALFGASGGGTGGRGPTTASGRIHANQSEGGPNNLLT
jgi:hypothetical protein